MNQALTHPESVRFERLLPGPVERVWDYLTRPDLRRTWLAESAEDFGAVTRCQPLRSIEFSLRDSSIVSMELEPHGSKVMLVLTHRRVPAWLAGAATVIAVALFMFTFGASNGPLHQRETLGPKIVRSAQSLQFPTSLKFPSSGSARLYGMLGGRC